MRTRYVIMLAILGCARLMYAAPLYTFTTITFPGSSDTVLSGINNLGQIVGNSSGNGFIYTNGGFAPLAVPGASASYPAAINNAGQITGWFDNNTPPGTHGFLDNQGNFTSIDVPGSIYGTLPQGINDAGRIVGYYFAPTGITGFTYLNGSIASLSVPGATFSQPWGINNAGQIILQTNTGSGSYLDSNGVFTQIAAPGAIASTHATGINNLGQITGFFQDSAGGHIFVDTAGAFTVLDVPGNDPSIQPEALGINDKGQIVGEYSPNATTTYGFVATPVAQAIPEPSSILLLGSGAVATVFAVRRRRRR